MIQCSFARKPVLHLCVCGEAVLIVAAVLRIHMVTIPEAPFVSTRDRSCVPQIPERFHDELYCCSCIGDKHQIEMFWIGTKETQCSLPCIVDDLARQLRRRTRRVGIAVEIRDQVHREGIHQGFGIYCGSSTV
jgi:hypothetical protein